MPVVDARIPHRCLDPQLRRPALECPRADTAAQTRLCPAVSRHGGQPAPPGWRQFAQPSSGAKPSIASLHTRRASPVRRNNAPEHHAYSLALLQADRAWLALMPPAMKFRVHWWTVYPRGLAVLVQTSVTLGPTLYPARSRYEVQSEALACAGLAAKTTSPATRGTLHSTAATRRRVRFIFRLLFGRKGDFVAHPNR